MPIHTQEEAGLPWTEPPGSITCMPDHQLDITIYNRYEEVVSMTYNLDTWQYSCIEDDYFSIFFEFGKREFFEGKDLCFANEDYVPENIDPPFVVNNNCYGPASDDWEDWPFEQRNTRWRAREASPETGNPWNYWDCHTEGYRVDLRVVDNPDANEYWLPDGCDESTGECDPDAKENHRTLREPYMWVQIDFQRVKDYFQIFPEDKAKISFWKGNLASETPNSVTISPAEDMKHICEPWRAADEIICENLSVFCTSPDDTVNLRIAAAGEILCWGSDADDGSEAGWRACGAMNADGANAGYNMCSEIVADAFDYETMQAALTDDPDTYEANLGRDYLYHVKVNDHEEGADSNAWFSFKYGTYYRSNAEICFTGDFFPFQSPSCHLHNSGLPVATQIHNPHEYAMDNIIMETLINAPYTPFETNEPVVFDLGGELDLTNQLTNALRGYVDLENIEDAVATSITILTVPTCGALYRETVAGSEE